MSFYNSPGLLAEENHLFLATDLYDESLEVRARTSGSRS